MRYAQIVSTLLPPSGDAPEIRLISALQTHPLRSAILRPGFPPGSAANDGDDDAHTAHFGCFVEGEIVAVASIFPEAAPDVVRTEMEAAYPPETLAAAWRLRGMAVAAGLQRKGYGAAVVEACLAHVAQHGGTLLWCNARVTALGFYHRAGFDVFGDEFEVPKIGPHYVMARRASS